MGDVEFIDADSGFHGQQDDKLSFRIVLMKHFNKIADLGSKEFRGGYWINKNRQQPNGVTAIEKQYVEDSREAYCNAICVLYDLVLPHLLINKKFRHDKSRKFYEEAIDCNDNLEGLRQNFLKNSEKDDTEILSIEMYQGDDKEKLEGYKFAKLRLCRKLFQTLSCFLCDKGYFAGESIEE